MPPASSSLRPSRDIWCSLSSGASKVLGNVLTSRINHRTHTHIFPQTGCRSSDFFTYRVIDKFMALSRRSQVLENLTHLFPSYIYITCMSTFMINNFYYLGFFFLPELCIQPSKFYQFLFLVSFLSFNSSVN